MARNGDNDLDDNDNQQGETMHRLTQDQKTNKTDI
jgi:hypothetical protein